MCQELVFSVFLRNNLVFVLLGSEVSIEVVGHARVSVEARPSSEVNVGVIAAGRDRVVSTSTG